MGTRKVIFLIVLIMCTMLLSSCSDKQQTIPKDSKSEAMESGADIESGAGIENKQIPKRIEKTLSSGIKADADIEIPENRNSGQIKKYNVKLQELDFEKIYSRFIGSEEIVEKDEDMIKGSLGNGKYQYYRTQSGKQLIGNGGVYVSYSAPEYVNVQVEGNLLDMKKSPSTNQDFSFETRENAKKKIDEFFHDLDINVYSQFECYALDYKWLQEQNRFQMDEEMREELKKAGKLEETDEITWNQDLDCYLFMFQAEMDGIPVTDQVRDVKNNTLPAPYIYVAYSKDGIVQFTVSYLFQEMDVAASGSILDTEQALELLDQKYNSIIMEGEYTITKMRLEYIPDTGEETGTYTLVPAWRFYMVHKYEAQSKEDVDKLETIEIPAEVLFHAIDGTEIITGVGI